METLLWCAVIWLYGAGVWASLVALTQMEMAEGRTLEGWVAPLALAWPVFWPLSLLLTIPQGRKRR